MSLKPSLQKRKPKFCLSLLPHNEEELISQLAQSTEADMIEIRLDFLRGVDLGLIQSYQDKPLIAAIRTEDEDGFFVGSPSELSAVYRQAIEAGVDYVDISLLHANEILPQLEIDGKAKLILSVHTYERDNDALKRRFREMMRTKADTYKLVFSAADLNDNATALDLMDYAEGFNIPFVIHAQGEQGKMSRIIGSLRGNAWTYVSLADDLKTAPGQLTLKEAVEQYYLHEKRKRPRIVGLTGFPLQQSRGWMLFNRIFHRRGMNALYLNFPTENIEEFWQRWEKSIDALSVTIPHKENILRFASGRSAEVELSGVCNTLVKRGAFWEAYNTDLLAMLELLTLHRERISSALVYGTGATSRSAIAALKRLGIGEIFLMGRNKEIGKYLAEKFSITFLESDTDVPGLSLIIQTTPVGMHPHVDDMPACAALVKGGMIVMDVVHNPPGTRLLRFAKEKGCSTISGQEMYFHQAVLQYELFTGDRISVDQMRKLWNELSNGE